jgi:hypothetical protein
MKKPAHEVLIEDIGELLAEIASQIKQGKLAPYGDKVSVLSRYLKILQQIEIPYGKLPWVKTNLEQLVEEYEGRIESLENLLKITASKLTRDNEATPDPEKDGRSHPAESELD